MEPVLPGSGVTTAGIVLLLVGDGRRVHGRGALISPWHVTLYRADESAV